MTNQSRFIIENNISRPLIVFIEPEGAAFPLGKGEQLSVIDSFVQEPVTVKLGMDKGETIISVWPGDGVVKVEKDGVDIFDLM
jgi:hypothetical protein